MGIWLGASRVRSRMHPQQVHLVSVLDGCSSNTETATINLPREAVWSSNASVVYCMNSDLFAAYMDKAMGNYHHVVGIAAPQIYFAVYTDKHQQSNRYTV